MLQGKPCAHGHLFGMHLCLSVAQAAQPPGGANSSLCSHTWLNCACTAGLLNAAPWRLAAVVLSTTLREAAAARSAA